MVPPIQFGSQFLYCLLPGGHHSWTVRICKHLRQSCSTTQSNGAVKVCKKRMRPENIQVMCVEMIRIPVNRTIRPLRFASLYILQFTLVEEYNIFAVLLFPP